MCEIKALIFDFDGLILETEWPVFNAWRECYEHHGHELKLKDYAACVGSDVTCFNPVTDLEERHSESIDWNLWDKNRRQSISDQLNNRPPLPGVVERLIEAQEMELPCAVASSSPRSWVEPYLKRLNIRHYFESIHCLDDVKKPKPDPELFLAAADRLSVKPQEALIFEDSLNGLYAAQAAGIRCVVIPSPVTMHLEFEHANAKLGTLDEMSLIEIMDLV